MILVDKKYIDDADGVPRVGGGDPGFDWAYVHSYIVFPA